MRFLIVFLSILVFFSCGEKKKLPPPAQDTHPQSESNKQPTNEEKYVSLLYEKVPEISEKGKEIEKLSDGKVRVGVQIDSDDSDEKYYIARVYENHEDHTVPIWDFYINKEDSGILYYDAMNDELISLQEWRKNR